MSEDRKFEEFEKKVLMQAVKLNPVLATYLGVHKYDSLLPDGSKEGILKEKRLIEKGEKELKKFHISRLSFENQINLKVLRAQLKIWNFSIEDYPLWKMFPDSTITVPDAIFSLYIRDFAPLEVRFKSIKERLLNTPKYLEQVESRVAEPKTMFVNIAKEMAAHIPEFLSLISIVGKQIFNDDEIETIVEDTNTAFKSHMKWLEDLNTDENYQIGRKNFEKLLKLRGIDTPVSEILKYGETMLKLSKKRLAEYSKSIDPTKSIKEVKSMLSETHPKDFSNLLTEVKSAIMRAKEFVISSKFATILENDTLTIMETPSYLVPVLPYAAYLAPGRFDVNQKGVYFVSPPQNEQMLKDENVYTIENTAVHEAYPGHHLQMLWSNKDSYHFKNLINAPEFVEGWAHYCEEATKELGFNDDAAHRFSQTEDLIFRAVRIIVDIKLSTGEMSFDQAVEFMREQLDRDRKGIENDVKRYTFTPGYQLSYLFGRKLIMDLREELSEKYKYKFNLQTFHDLLLQTGVLPMKYKRELALHKFEELLKKEEL